MRERKNKYIYRKYFLVACGRLVTVSVKTKNGTAKNTFAYDKNGRVISETDANGAVTYIAYDAYGNAIETTDGEGNTTKSRYDALDRLTETVDAKGNVTGYEYDSLGGRKNPAPNCIMAYMSYKL